MRTTSPSHQQPIIQIALREAAAGTEDLREIRTTISTLLARMDPLSYINKIYFELHVLGDNEPIVQKEDPRHSLSA